MASERIVSPGVFTRENDQSFLPQGIANIGGSIVGPFPKGPGFAPTLLTTQADLESVFGKPDGVFYTPYTAQQYLSQQGTVTIVRVGGLGGYIQKDPIIIKAISGSMSFVSGSFVLSSFATSSGHEEKVLAVLANTAYDSGELWAGFSSSSLLLNPTSSTAPTTEFTLVLKNGATTYGNYNFSLDNGSPAYISNVFGKNPQVGLAPTVSGSLPKAAYLYTEFDGTIDAVVNEMLNSGSWKIAVEPYDNINPDTGETGLGSAMTFTDGIPGGGDDTHAGSAFDLTNAMTPWIVSQDMSGTKYELFKFHTLSDGTPANRDLKIVISDVKVAGTIPGSLYGSFSVTVRSFTDSDRHTDVLETFSNVTLDPNSSNFIGRSIGDYYQNINSHGKVLQFGDFANKSKYVRVEVTEAPYPETAIPFGFEAYATPIGGKFSVDCPPMRFSRASIYSKNIGKYASGVCFEPAPVGADGELSGLFPTGVSPDASNDNREFFAPVPVTATSGSNVPFDLFTFCGVPSVYEPANESTNIKKRKFALGFQGGFDGQGPAIPVLLGDSILPTNEQGLDCSTIDSSGSVAYAQALAALGNADEFDINLLAIPGINYNDHSFVTSLAIDTCENRGDCFFIMDIWGQQSAGGNSIDNVVTKADELDTNYAATYYPWVKIIDTNMNKYIKVPPSVVMPAVYAQSDKVSAEWFAPAGLNRGGITQAVQVLDRTTHEERDTLYEGRINPIAAFPGQGIVAWGQKTLQQKPSALDRVNVRRLLIALKKFIASTSKYLVFEQNVAATRNKFLSIVNPYLESVQQRSGLYAFKVVMDETNNTPDIIDRNILIGDIYLQPAKTVEFIILNFNVLPTGATFPNG
jgi:hypothetical protein